MSDRIVLKNFNRADWNINFLSEGGTIGSKTHWCSRVVRALSNVPVIGGLFHKNDPVVGLSAIYQSMTALITDGATQQDEDLVAAAKKAEELGQHVLAKRKREEPKLSSMIEKIGELVKVSTPPPQPETEKPTAPVSSPEAEKSISSEEEAALIAATQKAEEEAAARKAQEEATRKAAEDAAKEAALREAQKEPEQQSSSISDPITPPSQRAEEMAPPAAPSRNRRRRKTQSGDRVSKKPATQDSHRSKSSSEAASSSRKKGRK